MPPSTPCNISPAELRNAGPGTAPHLSAGPEDAAAVVESLRQSALFRDYQRAFEASTGLPLVLRTAGSFRTPLQGSKRANPFCTRLAQAAGPTCAACLQLQQRVEQEAQLGPKTRQCYAGLNETAVPVRIGQRVIGFLQTGQIFFHAPSLRRFQLIAPSLRAVHGGTDGLRAAYLQTRVIAPAKYGAIVRLLAIFAEHLATVSNQLLLSAATAEPVAIVRGRAFIAGHSADALCVGDVARAVNVSAFYFSRLFKKETGLTFTNYLARERVEAVKRNLLNTQVRVSEAAFAAGFQSLSQFNRVFRRVAGEAPGCYRSRLQGLLGKLPLLRPVALAPAA